MRASLVACSRSTLWLGDPEEAGNIALASIGISALTTGFTSAMIAFDMDVDVLHRKNQTWMYGYIPDDHTKRGRCFLLMLTISAIHNLSRSMGAAMLASNENKSLLPIFLVGEISLYLLYKFLRNDWRWWIPVQGWKQTASSLLSRVLVKIIVDFSGCLHFRHPFEMGGAAFSLGLVYAQVFPFVARQFYHGEEETKSSITIFLIINLGLWLVLNIAFFSTIKAGYLDTFFGVITAPQYTCMLYISSEEDSVKFDAVFSNRIQFTKSIHCEVKEWVKANVEQWKKENPPWFVIEQIPDEFLPRDLLEAEGGAHRRRSGFSLREMVIPGGQVSNGGAKIDSDSKQIHPE